MRLTCLGSNDSVPPHREGIGRGIFRRANGDLSAVTVSEGA